MQELDEFTLRKAMKGDHRAYKSLYDLYSPFVYKIAFRMAAGDPETAAEMLQSVFIRIYNSLKKFSFDSALSTWIYRITYNSALTILGDRKKRGDSSNEYVDQLQSSDKADHYDMQQAVNAVLKNLSAEERFLLVSREALGLSFEELSISTGRSSEALRTQLFRLKENLRSKFSSSIGDIAT